MRTQLLAATACLLAFAAAAAQGEPLKPDEFVQSWLVLKPLTYAKADQTPDEPAQQQAFAEDALNAQTVRPRPGLNQQAGSSDSKRVWQMARPSEGTVDLGEDSPFSVTYAWAEIDMPAATSALLGIGSDDAVKVWLNGKLIHEKWANRPVTPDDDVVSASFKRGKNQILLKVLNVHGGHGFSVRRMGEKAQGNKLAQAASNADLAALKSHLDLGMAVDSVDDLGLTPLQAARIQGRSDVVRFLISRGANASAPQPPPEKLAERMFALRIKSEGSGAAVLAAQDGKVLFEKGYGLSNVEQRIPVTPQTHFRIGSITKQFTAAAILKLQEQGKLNVQDKLSKYIPDYPRGNEVTLHHLLTHTSGIHNYTNNPGFLEKTTTPVKLDELVRQIKMEPYDFDPGAKWSYSNSGYVLLGYIVEKASGQTYGDFLKASFFEPLGMKNTGVHHAGLQLANEALGYEFKQSQFSRAKDWDMSWGAAAGGLYSTVGDLHRWNEEVFNGKVLAEPSTQAAFTAVKTADGLSSGYGYGWGVMTVRGSQIISHSGGLPGFSSYLLRLPRERFTVVVLENALPGPPAASVDRLGNSMVSFYLGDKLASRESETPAQVSTKAFDAIVGRYDVGGGYLAVTREGDQVFTQFLGGPRVELFPRSETEYFWKGSDAQLSFVKDSSGKIIKAVQRSAGVERSAQRVEETAEIAIDSAELDAVLGKYDYGQLGKLAVTREDNRLYAQLPPQPKIEIFREAPNEYFWKVVPAQITFVRDAQGKVVKAIHRQGGQTLDAPKVE